MIDHAAMSDAAKREELLDEIIYRAVRGEETPWLLDPEFKARGTFEDRFRDGDKQILLWEIDDCAQSGRPIPKWAAEALHGLLYGAVKGQAKSWDDVFGRLYAKGTQGARRMSGLSVMVDVWFRICELSREGRAIDHELFHTVHEEFKIAEVRVRDYYRRMRDFVSRIDWPDR